MTDLAMTDLTLPPLALTAIAAAAILMLLFRLPFVGRAIRALFSFACLAFALFLILQHASLDPGLSRMSAILGLDEQKVEGGEIHVPMGRDGHFWVTATIGGETVRMLVDSGATVTALSTATAARAGIVPEAASIPIVLRTANGMVRAQAGVVDTLVIGPIVGRRLQVVVSPGLGETDVLGMNFLSELQSWRVEGRTLILTPKPRADD